MKRIFAVFAVFALFAVTSFAEENESVSNAETVTVSQEEDESEAEINEFENATANNVDEEYEDDSKKDKKLKFFGIRVINQDDFFELVTRFLFNMIFVLLVVRFLYYAISKRKDYLFTYILISVIIFLLCFLLGNVKIQIGFALGLFAIFGIIRYRTTQMPIKEMTYLFIVIGLSVINALANKKISYAELLFTNIAIFGVTYLLEKVWLLRHESHKIINYDNIELIKPELYDALKADLEERTGLNINRIEIGNVNFLTDSAKIQIYYYEQDNDVNILAEQYSSGDNI